ncbi:MAG: hypothetical protein OEV42_19110 [Deltaproteobacteria bacterium]|nr:hypothetical protein [Deltaproteobacteria bacterium]
MSCINYIQRIRCLLLVMISLLIIGCGDDDSNPNIQSVDYLPSCDSVMEANGSVNAKDLFSVALVDPSSVDSSLPIGELEAGDLTPINHELGFLLYTTNIDIIAPTDLYVKSLTSTQYISGPRAGETDFGMTYQVCSHLVNSKEEIAVEGDYAHMTAAYGIITTALVGATCVEDLGDVESTVKCSVNYVNNYLLIDKGTLLGSGGGAGLSDYKPGFDANLTDFRFENNFVNPDRIGAEEGPGAGFRYGACTYEYFLEPTKTAYLDKVGVPGNYRVSATDPCGKLSDVGQAGTAAGIWISEDKAGLDISTDLFGVMSNLLVLADDLIAPDTEMNISTDLISVAPGDGKAALVSIIKKVSGDVNPAFKEMLPGTVYCLEGTSDIGGIITDFYYYLELIDGGDTLKLEALDAICNATPEASRTFSENALRFVR